MHLLGQTWYPTILQHTFYLFYESLGTLNVVVGPSKVKVINLKVFDSVRVAFPWGNCVSHKAIGITVGGATTVGLKE